MQQNRFRINIKSSFSCIFQLRRMAAVSPQQQNWRYSVLFCTYLSNKYRILCFPGFHSGLENVFVGVLMQLCRTDVYPGTICGRCFTVDGLDRPHWPRGAVCSVQSFPTPREEEADSCSQGGGGCADASQANVTPGRMASAAKSPEVRSSLAATLRTLDERGRPVRSTRRSGGREERM